MRKIDSFFIKKTGGDRQQSHATESHAAESSLPVVVTDDSSEKPISVAPQEVNDVAAPQMKSAKLWIFGGSQISHKT
jgi:hypothetical protein